MKSYTIYSFLLITWFGWSCQTPSTSNKEDVSETSKTIENYEPLPQEVFTDMIQRVNKGEITFYGDIPFSLSINQAACVTYFQGVANMAVPDPNCAEVKGRIFFLQDAESVIDAEFFVSDDCAYFKFFAGDQQYANLLQGQAPSILRQMLDPSTRPTQPN